MAAHRADPCRRARSIDSSSFGGCALASPCQPLTEHPLGGFAGVSKHLARQDRLLLAAASSTAPSSSHRLKSYRRPPRTSSSARPSLSTPDRGRRRLGIHAAYWPRSGPGEREGDGLKKGGPAHARTTTGRGGARLAAAGRPRNWRPESGDLYHLARNA